MPRYEIDKATGKRVLVEQTLEDARLTEKSAATEKKGERK